MTNQSSKTWGKVKVSRILQSSNTLRSSIRNGDIEKIQDAWDDFEQFIQFFMQGHVRWENTASDSDAVGQSDGQHVNA